MKTQKAIEQFNKMLGLNQEELADNEVYQPIINKIKTYSAKFNSSLTDTTCVATEWENGEGYDFLFYTDGGDEERISLHLDQIELIILLLIKFNHFAQ